MATFARSNRERRKRPARGARHGGDGRHQPRALQEQVRGGRGCGGAGAGRGWRRCSAPSPSGAPRPPPFRFNARSARLFSFQLRRVEENRAFLQRGASPGTEAAWGRVGNTPSHGSVNAPGFLFPFLQINRDGKFMFCPCGTKLNVIDVETGALHSLQQVRSPGLCRLVMKPLRIFQGS